MCNKLWMPRRGSVCDRCAFLHHQKHEQQVINGPFTSTVVPRLSLSPSCPRWISEVLFMRPQPVSIRQQGSPRCRPASCAPTRTIQHPRRGSVDGWMRRAMGGGEMRGRRGGGGGVWAGGGWKRHKHDEQLFTLNPV